MKSVLRSTALLSGSSAVTILVGLVSAKAWAVLLGAEQLGHMGLLQSLVGLAGLLAGTSIGTAVVRMGANALGRQDLDELAALRRAAWVLCLAFSALAVLIMLLFREPIAALMLGSPAQAQAVTLMTIPLVMNLLSGLQVSIVNSYHRVGALARLNVIIALVGTPVSLLCIWLWGRDGIIPAIIAGAAVSLIASTLTLVRAGVGRLPAGNIPATRAAAWRMLRFVGPYTLSMLVGTGMQMVVPALVLHSLGAESVGYLRAASAISITYLGFLLSAMHLDYYPRLSAVSHDPSELNRAVNQQHRFLMLIGAPLVLGTLTLSPLLVPIIYTAAFAPAVIILKWQLIGDLFKFSSWTIGTAVVARSSSRTLLLVELVAGANTLLGAWVGMRLFGLAGIGAGYMVTYIVHYAVVYAVMRRETGLIVVGGNLAMLGLAVGAALFITLLPSLTAPTLSLIVATLLTAVSGLVCVVILWREVLADKLAEPASLEVGR